MNTEQEITEYIKDADVCAITARQRAFILRRYIGWASERGMDAIDTDTLREYRESLTGDGRASGTINAYINTCNLFIAWERSRQGLPIQKRCKGVQMPRGHTRDAIPAAVVRELVSGEGIREGIEANKRDRAMMAVMAVAGCRAIEVSRMLIGDVESREDGSAVIRIQGKGRASKDDSVRIPASVMGIVYDYLSERDDTSPDAPLFSSTSNNSYGHPIGPAAISRTVKKALRSRNIDSTRLVCHSLRHTACTELIRAGTPIQEVSFYMRHADVRTTMLYVQEEGKERASERLGMLLTGH